MLQATVRDTECARAHSFLLYRKKELLSGNTIKQETDTGGSSNTERKDGRRMSENRKEYLFLPHEEVMKNLNASDSGLTQEEACQTACGTWSQ